MSMSGLEDDSSRNKMKATFVENNSDIFKADISFLNLHLDIYFNIF